MEQLLMSLANLGGMGALAAVLFLLHRDSIKTFRDELEEERTTHREQLKEERETCERRHQEIIASLGTALSSSMNGHRETQLQIQSSYQQTQASIRDLVSAIRSDYTQPKTQSR